MITYVQKRRGEMVGLTEIDQQRYTALRKKLATMADGQCLRIEYATPRNPLHHRKFFALLALIAENSETYDTVEKALLAVKLVTAHVEPFIDPRTGEILQLPKSISYEAMSQEQFEHFYQAALDGIVQHILQHMPREKADNIVELILREWA